MVVMPAALAATFRRLAAIGRLPLAALLVGALLCSGCGASSPPFAWRAPVSILQDQAHLLADPTATLDLLRSLGVSKVRISVGWDSLAPDPTSRTPPSHFDAAHPAAYPAAAWGPYDAAVRAAEARGIGVYLLLTGPAPLWATTPAPRGTAPHNPGVYEPSATRFGAFVRAVSTRYDGSYTPAGEHGPLPEVRFWSIWDEPNYGYDLAPQAIHDVDVSPYLYRGLLDAAWTALTGTGHTADGTTLLIGETAPRGAAVPGVANGMFPLRFLRALYCLSGTYHPLRGTAAAARHCPTTAAGSRRFAAQHPALFDATGFAAHLYTPGQVAAPNLRSTTDEPDYAGLADLPRLEQALDRVTEAYGSSRQLPIYDTEFGFQTDPPPSSCGCVFLSPAMAAYYLNWAEYLQWRDPRVRAEAQYLLYDAPGPPGRAQESEFSSGLLFLSGAPKPSYDAYRLPIFLPLTSARPRQALTVWGEVRPASYAARDSGSVPAVAIQFRATSRGGWRTVRTVAVSGSDPAFEIPVRFPASGSVRLRWSYPRAYADLPAGTPRTVMSRTQAVSVR